MRARVAVVGLLIAVTPILVVGGCGSQPSAENAPESDPRARPSQPFGSKLTVEARPDAVDAPDSSSCREVALVATKEADGVATLRSPMTFPLPAAAADNQGNTSAVVFTFSNSAIAGSEVSCIYHRSGPSYALSGCSNDAGALEMADTFDLHFTNAYDASSNPDEKHSVSLTLDEAPPCGARDAAADGPRDVSGGESRTDAPSDAGADVRAEAPVDVADAPIDAVADVPADVPQDAALDVPADVIPDTGADVPTCNFANCTPSGPS